MITAAGRPNSDLQDRLWKPCPQSFYFLPLFLLPVVSFHFLCVCVCVPSVLNRKPKRLHLVKHFFHDQFLKHLWCDVCISLPSFLEIQTTRLMAFPNISTCHLFSPFHHIPISNPKQCEELVNLKRRSKMQRHYFLDNGTLWIWLLPLSLCLLPRWLRGPIPSWLWYFPSCYCCWRCCWLSIDLIDFLLTGT